MKILCTGDLHIGKIVNQFSMIEDQTEILEQIKDIILNNEVDVLVIAGDLYDRSIPSTEAIRLLDEFLYHVVHVLHVQVLIISGNHDSNERLSFGTRFLKKEGLYIQTNYRDGHVTIKLNNEKIHFYLIPYIHPKDLSEQANVEINTYEDTIEYIKGQYEINPQEVNLAVYHGLVFGEEKAIESESERIISVGTMGQVSLTAFKEFDYTILGHLHQNQCMSETIEYTGSPLKYSFSEVNHIKSVTLLDVTESQIKREKIKLNPLRDFEIKHEFFDELMQGTPSDNYMKIILKDKEDIYEPIQRLRTLYPNIMILEKESMTIEKPISFNQTKSRDIGQVFEEFYTVVSDAELTEIEQQIIDEIKEELM